MAESKFIEVGTHVVVDKKFVGTVKKVAVHRNRPEDADEAVYLVEYDKLWGKRTGWFGAYYLHVITTYT